MAAPNPDLTVSIQNREIGPEAPPFVIAEMSANHNGSLDTALAIVDAAVEAGCDAIKLQTYRGDTITLDAKGPDFDITEGPWAGRTLYELYNDAHLPWAWHKPIFEHAAKRGIIAFSAPFDSTAVDFLEDLDCPAYKIASYEIVDHGLIAACAKTGKPLIISTGLANLQEIQEAVAVAQAHGCAHPIVLHCISGYPTPFEEANLERIHYLQDNLPTCLIGLSDHSAGAAIPTGAVALGACVIEKHITLDKSGDGEDDFFSLEPHEMKLVCDQAKAVWLGTRPLKLERAKSELSTASGRRSLYVVAPMAKGEVFTHDNVRSIRPGHGLKPKFLDTVLGKKSTQAIDFAQALKPNMVDGLEIEE